MTDASTSLTLEQALLHAVNCHRNGQLPEAEQFYRAILQAQPRQPDANHNLGVLIVGLNQPAVALPFFKMALEVNATQEQYWFSYIDALIRAGQYDAARQVIVSARQHGQDGVPLGRLEQGLNALSPATASTSACYETAIAYREAGCYREAADCLRTWLLEHPQDASALALLGHVYLLDRQDAAASIAIERARVIAPLSPIVQRNIVRLLLKQQKNEAALQAAQIVCQSEPENLESMLLLATAYGASKQDDQALPLLDRVLQADSTYAEAFASRAVLKLRANQFLDALSDAERALGIKPHLVPLWGMVGSLRYQLKNVPGAIAALRKALEYEPDNIGTMVTLGEFLRQDSQRDDAVALLQEAVVRAPGHAGAWTNLGATLQEAGRVDEAKAAYANALKINPQSAEIASNLGALAKDAGKWEEARHYFEQALAIKPEHVEVLVNQGNILRNLGLLDEAETSFCRALAINPKHPTAWSFLLNTSIALQARVPFGHRSVGVSREKLNSAIQATVDFSIYGWLRNLADRNNRASWEKVMSALPSRFDDGLVTGHATLDSCDKFKQNDRIAILLHFGRSGSGLLHSLLDSHPEISTVPSIYLRGFFNDGVWQRLCADGVAGLPARFVDMFEVLFDAESPKPIPSLAGEDASFAGRNDGMTCVGESRNESLRVDKEAFCAELIRLMNRYDTIGQYDFFKMVHAAYEHAIGTKTEKSAVFYHIHNPTDYAMLNFSRHAPDAQIVMMVRDPVKSCESWCRSVQHKYYDLCQRIVTMLFAIDQPAFQVHKSVGVRLEDLKQHPKETIPSLCAWLGIKESSSLYEMTAQGKKWWGDPSSPSYDRKEAMSPFGEDVSVRTGDPVFSAADQFVLHTLFYPFSVRFGYSQPDPGWFKKSLKDVRVQLEGLMDFEKTIADSMQLDSVQLQKHCAYQYLRACMYSRLDILNKYGEYPHMLDPLNISRG